jgi:hypothetical protein
MASFCWQCGKPLKTMPNHAEGIRREIATGQWVRMHKVCAETFDRDIEIVRIETGIKPGFEQELKKIVM